MTFAIMAVFRRRIKRISFMVFVAFAMLVARDLGVDFAG